MPDVSIDGLDPKSFIVEESPGDFDYIFSVKKISLLKGGEFQQKRKDVNRFWRENQGAKLNLIDLNDSKIKTQIIETIKIWENNKNIMKKEYEIMHELSATNNLFESDCIDLLLCLGLYSEDKMLGYAIGEYTNNKYVIVHFLRSILSSVGVNEVLMQGYGKYLESLNIEYINFESDLDHESIRRFKTSWRPINFLKRYTVRYTHT